MGFLRNGVPSYREIQKHDAPMYSLISSSRQSYFDNFIHYRTIDGFVDSGNNIIRIVVTLAL